MPVAMERPWLLGQGRGRERCREFVFTMGHAGFKL